MRKIILLLLLTSLSYGTTRVYEGVARMDGQEAYLIIQTFEMKGEVPISSSAMFTGLTGELIAKMSVDYTVSLELPNFQLQDLRNNLQWGLKREKGKLLLYRKDKSGVTTSSYILDNGPLVVLPGIHHYIAGVIDEILVKGHVRFTLLVPPRLEAVPVRLKVRGIKEAMVELEMKVDDWSEGFFSPRTRFVFDMKKNEIFIYEGISQLLGPGGLPM